jgi:hypothetical protein
MTAHFTHTVQLNHFFFILKKRQYIFLFLKLAGFYKHRNIILDTF